MAAPSSNCHLSRARLQPFCSDLSLKSSHAVADFNVSPSPSLQSAAMSASKRSKSC